MSEDLDVEGEFNHIRLTLTVGTAASLVAGLLYGVGPRYAPASDFNAATVDEIVG